MRWPNSSSFSSHTRTVPSPLCRKSPKATSVSRPNTNTPSMNPSSADSIAVRVPASCLAVESVYWLNGHSVTANTLHSYVLVSSTHTPAGLILSHMGVVHSGNQLGLGAGRPNPTWDVFFHLAAPLHTEADLKWERHNGLRTDIQTQWMSQDLTDYYAVPWIHCSWH